MNISKPEFTVIIATHNRAQLLGRALRSLHQQTYHCQQIIVVSDANDADTYQLAASLMRPGDMFIQRLGVAGPAESRNLGIKLISGDYFIFLDDDDSFQPDFLENLVRCLADSPSGDKVFYTNFEVVNERLGNGENCITGIQEIDLGGYDPQRVYVKNFIPNNCLIFPRHLAAEIAFDAQIAYEDWDFILCACAKASLVHLAILGPKVHKNTVEEIEARGKKNDSGLLECYIKTYSKHPPINTTVALWRQELFASVGLDIATVVPNEPTL